MGSRSIGRPVSVAPPPSGPPLLEREAEIATIRALVDAAAHGTGRMLVIEGRAGMGKTRLVAEARSAGAGAGFKVLFARSAELEQDFAFCVVRQLFEPLLASASGNERTDLMSGPAAVAERLFDDGEPDPESGGADMSFAMLNGLYWVAANVAQRRPLMIVVDDLHWSDVPTLHWLTYLGRRLEDLPILVVAGLRPPEQTTRPEVLAEVVELDRRLQPDDVGTAKHRVHVHRQLRVETGQGADARTLTRPKTSSSRRSTRRAAAFRCSCRPALAG